MSDTERKQAEKQVKIYLTVLAGLLIVAVMVTMFTLYRDEQPQAQNEGSGATSEGYQSAEDEPQVQPSGEAQPVERGFNDANSQIENDSSGETSQVVEKPEESSAPMEEPSDEEESAGQEEIEDGEAEPQNLTAFFDPDEDLMVWPVSGVVLMDYSPNALIYDETLDLYRTNDSISIGALETEDVLAAADGIVTDIGRTDALGNYVVLDNGNGYETTYGQLSEEMLVALGETVAQGEVIGRISEPSWYSSALGTHLTFTVTANGESVNPLNYLENVLEDE